MTGQFTVDPEAGTAEPGTGAPLGRQVRKAFTWSLAGMLVGKAGTLVSGVILARVLFPEDYGVFAVAQVALLLVANLNDLGLEQALVRWPGDIDRVAPTARTVILGSSVAQFAVMFALAPVLASSMDAPAATGVIQLLSFSVVVNGLFAVPSAMLTRTFRQDLRTTADFIGFVVTTGGTLALALSGWGVWSLAWGRLAGNLVNSLLHAWFARPGYPYGYNPVIARRLLREGLPIAGTTIVGVLVIQVDTLVVGRVLGATELGFYAMAFALSSWPVTVFAVAVWRVAVPAFARMQDDPERLRSAFLRAFGLLMAVTLPVCVLLSGLALPLIRFVYGEKWAAAALALTVLAALGGLRVAMQLMTDLLVAVGRGKVAFALQGVWLAALVPALAVGAHVDGIAGAAWAHVLVATGIILPLHLWAVHPHGIDVPALVRAAARPAIAAAAAAGVIVLVGHSLAPSAGLSDFVTLACAGAASMAVYAAIVSPMRHTALAGLRR